MDEMSVIGGAVMLIKGIGAVSALLSLVITWLTGNFRELSWLWVIPLTFLGLFLGLGILAFLVFWFLCAIIDTEKPQEHDSRFYRNVLNLYVEAILMLLQMDVHTRGLEKTPPEGRFLLVCNHLDILDPVTLFAFFKNSQLAFISKQENRNMFLVGKIMHKVMCQPINRENDREALKTILNCIRLIKEDEVSIAVFPEGYTSLDEKLHHFRNGVFKIALKAKVPIVVCTLQNTQKIFRNAARLRRTDVQLHLLDVIPYEQLQGHTAVEVGERIYHMMLRNLGPDYLPEEAVNG